ncbi:unnamed protein product, partial [Gulo gulo]
NSGGSFPGIYSSAINLEVVPFFKSPFGLLNLEQLSAAIMQGSRGPFLFHHSRPGRATPGESKTRQSKNRDEKEAETGRLLK